MIQKLSMKVSPKDLINVHNNKLHFTEWSICTILCWIYTSRIHFNNAI